MKPESAKKLQALQNYLGACDNLTPDQKAHFSQMIAVYKITNNTNN